tara:strand:- start:1341 stop:1943 length:603 start_codon:yes stop_codon:yes gene_type:complete
MEKSPPDNKLIKNVQCKNCSESLSLLIQRHAPLCFDVFRKYSHLFENNGVNYNDVSDEKEMLIYKSAMSFNPKKKAKFSTWLGNQARYHCLNAVNKNRLVPTDDEYLDFVINKEALDSHDGNMPEDIDYIKNILSQTKDKRIPRIFHIRYFQNPRKKTSWNKVAKEIGVSTQTVINLHNKTIKMLKFKMEKGSIFALDRI